ncbi:hypothetical protein GCM10027403_17130 [Arthrobacter tecti]
MNTAAENVEIIVDNPQAEITGTWATSSFAANYYGSNYRTTNRSVHSAASRVARWRFEVPAAGEYIVGVWLPDGRADRAPEVKYRVHHAGTVSEFTLDHRLSGGQWRQLGRGPLTFNGSSDEFVELRVADVPGTTGGPALHIMADAIRVSTPPPPVTVAPSGVKTVEGRNYVELSWSPVEGAESYVVSRTADGGTPQELSQQNGPAYIDLDLDLGKTYTYSVRGQNPSGLGPASGSVNAALKAGVPLAAVQGLVVENVNGNPSLKWLPARDATSYRIERSNKSGGKFRPVAEVTGTEYE